MTRVNISIRATIFSDSSQVEKRCCDDSCHIFCRMTILESLTVNNLRLESVWFFHNLQTTCCQMSSTVNLHTKKWAFVASVMHEEFFCFSDVYWCKLQYLLWLCLLVVLCYIFRIRGSTWYWGRAYISLFTQGPAHNTLDTLSWFSGVLISMSWSWQSDIAGICIALNHRRTGRHFTGRAEKNCPENNNWPWK